jgi:hypothetical protein
VALNGWLIDKSAIIRLANSPDANVWVSRINEGLVHLSSITRLEIGYSARNAKDLLESFSSPPLSKMPIQLLSPVIEERAWDVLKELSKSGKHRAPSIPDLLIAATAEKHGLSVLHLDKDFEIISKITGQAQERIKSTTSKP